jgi:hypothetical protein
MTMNYMVGYEIMHAAYACGSPPEMAVATASLAHAVTMATRWTPSDTSPKALWPPTASLRSGTERL